MRAHFGRWPRLAHESLALRVIGRREVLGRGADCLEELFSPAPAGEKEQGLRIPTEEQKRVMGTNEERAAEAYHRQANQPNAPQTRRRGQEISHRHDQQPQDAEKPQGLKTRRI